MLVLSYNIVSVQDSSKFFNNISQYHLNKLIYLEYERVEGSSIDSIIKPMVLVKLDAFNGRLPMSQFADMIKYRKELKLSSVQIDTIIGKTIFIEHLKSYNKAHQLYEFKDVKEFEASNIPVILDSMQYDTYLNLKVMPKATSALKNDLAGLKQFDLLKGQDSTSVSKAILAYETQVLVANERLHNENTQNNALNYRRVMAAKPMILRKIEINQRRATVEKAAKNSLAW